MPPRAHIIGIMTSVIMSSIREFFVIDDINLVLCHINVNYQMYFPDFSIRPMNLSWAILYQGHINS